MMHKAWCSIEEVPYCFARPSIKFQGHKGQKIDDLDQIWARLLGRSQLSNPSDLPCYFQLDFGWITGIVTTQVDISTIYIHNSSYIQNSINIFYIFAYLEGLSGDIDTGHVTLVDITGTVVLVPYHFNSTVHLIRYMRHCMLIYSILFLIEY